MSLAALALGGFFAIHPTVLYDASDVARLRAPQTAAAKDTHAALVKGAGYASSSPGSYGYAGDALFAFAVDCAITGDATICDGAHAWLTYVVSQGAWEGTGNDPVDFVQTSNVSGVAVAYDVLSDTSGAIPASARVTASERDAIKQRLAAEAARLYDQTASGTHPNWWAREYLQNHNWEDVGALVYAAVALNGEISPDPTCTWLAAATENFQHVDAQLRRIADGTWHEGYSYEGSSISAWLRFVFAYERARRPGAVSCAAMANAPDFAAVPWFDAFVHYRAVSSLPGKMHQAALMHGDFFGWSPDEVAFAYRYAAARFHDGEAEWMAQAHLASQPHNTWGYEQRATALEYLSYDSSVVAAPAHDRDLFLSDLQGYVTRSGYDANAAVLAVKAGAFGGVANWNALASGDPTSPPDIDFGHDHDDDLSFWFYANGQWLAPEADGYSTHGYCTAGAPYVWNTAYHNSITIDGTGQIGDDDPCRGTGGGHVAASRQASVTAHAASDHVSYVAMEGAHLYPSALGLTELERQVLFVDRDCVVTRDTARASATHRWEWHSHALGAITRDGASIRAESKNDQALAIEVVAPTAWDASTSSDSLPHGPNANVYIDPDGQVSHVRVWNTTASAEDHQLVVMCPTTTSGWAARPKVAALGDVGSARGFTLARSGADEAWLFSDKGPTDHVTDGAARSLTGVAGGFVRGADGAITWVLVRGTSLGDDGHEVLSGDADHAALEARVAANVVAISSDGASHARVFASGATAATWNGAPASLRVDPADARYVVVDAPVVPGGDAGAGANARNGDGGESAASGFAAAGDPAGIGEDGGDAGCACRVGATSSHHRGRAAAWAVLVAAALFARARARHDAPQRARDAVRARPCVHDRALPIVVRSWRMQQERRHRDLGCLVERRAGRCVEEALRRRSDVSLLRDRRGVAVLRPIFGPILPARDASRIGKVKCGGALTS